MMAPNEGSWQVVGILAVRTYMSRQVDIVTQWDTHSDDEIALRLRRRQCFGGRAAEGSADHPNKEREAEDGYNVGATFPQ